LALVNLTFNKLLSHFSRFMIMGLRIRKISGASFKVTGTYF
jgi:hypothetical protein